MPSRAGKVPNQFWMMGGDDHFGLSPFRESASTLPREREGSLSHASQADELKRERGLEFRVSRLGSCLGPHCRVGPDCFSLFRLRGRAGVGVLQRARIGKIADRLDRRESRQI